jgi:hypothetical protein
MFVNAVPQGDRGAGGLLAGDRWSDSRWRFLHPLLKIGDV